MVMTPPIRRRWSPRCIRFGKVVRRSLLISGVPVDEAR